MNDSDLNNAIHTPFSISVPDDVLAHIKQRVASYPWHEMPDDGGWNYGTNMGYMRELCDYWVNTFDWRKQEAKLNEYPQFTVPIDGINMHYIIEKGSGSHPMPLLLSHGWPGSVAEFSKLIEPLAHPERFGGNIEDAFDVVVPSLPGFGFSGRPPRPYGPRKIASLLNSLMTDKLNFDGYLAQGGDWGGTISAWIGYDHAPACRAIHINILTLRHPEGPQNHHEQCWAEKFEQDQIMENGYRTLQATRPQTLSYAMMDSPVGVAAWIIEKFYSWSDTDGDDIESAHSKDELLTNIMIYIVTRTFNTASWIYYGRREEGGRTFSTNGTRAELPTACALFPAEMSAWPPRTYVDRMFNIQRWTKMPRGGHFPAMEEPELLIEDIRAFARQLRQDNAKE